MDDLITRLGELSRAVADDEEIGVELREVERQLDTASRRLIKAIRRVDG